MQDLKAVKGDKSIFRRWHHKGTAGLGQVKGEYEEILCRLVGEIDLGKELDKIIAAFK